MCTTWFTVSTWPSTNSTVCSESAGLTTPLRPPHPRSASTPSTAKPRRLTSETLPIGFDEQELAGLALAGALVFHRPHIEAGGGGLPLGGDQVPAECGPGQHRLHVGAGLIDAARVAPVVGRPVEVGLEHQVAGQGVDVNLA